MFTILALLSTIAKAENVEIGGIYYSLSNSEACVINNPNGYFGDIIIPEKITYQGVVYDVTSIQGEYDCKAAFAGCNLSSITIPSSIKTIGMAAFEGASIESVKISDLSSWCKIDFKIHWRMGRSFPSTNPLSIAGNLYLKDKLIDDLVIPEDVSSIKEAAFYGGNFKSITIHKGVNSVYSYSFYNCIFKDFYVYSPRVKFYTYEMDGPFNDINDATLHVRERYKESLLREDEFGNGWLKFTNIEYLEGIDFNLSYIVDDTEYKKIVYEEGEIITAEADPSKDGYTFSGWSEIPEKMPTNDVTVTGFFSPNTYKLTYNVDSEEYKVVEVKCDETITAEPEPTKKGMTFSGWSEIPEKMPAKDVTVTGTFGWSKVTKGGVIYQVYNAEDELAAIIGSDNASGEVKIVSPVEIDGNNYSVTDIVDFSFKNNTAITSVVIPESVRKIGDEAFYGCKNLAKIELGKSVNQIEPRAFAGIDKLTDITIYAEDVPSTDRTAFENSYIEDYVTLHVPAGSVEKYKAAAPWKNFKEIVAIPDADSDDTDVDVITIKSYGKGTYCSDYDLDFSYTENLKAFIVTGYDHKTNTIWLTRVKSLPAGTGIIVKGSPGDYKVKHVESLSVYANFLVGTTEDKKIKDVEGEMTNFVLSKGEWYRFDGEITLPKGMAYLPLPLSKFAGTRSLIEVYEDNDEGTTEIRTIEQGTLSSEHDVWFNLQGQRVDKPRKGLYIKNGKKVFIK